VKLLDGQAHDVDSSERSFKIAGSIATREALRTAGSVLLEPMMAVEVVTPEEYVGPVQGDLNSRRGQITGLEIQAKAQVVRAEVPLAQMFGYVNTLRSMTQGRATYTMQFANYAEVPPAVAGGIVKIY
jgi:elongation factor G